ncbi:glutathione S-transferase family protein [Synechocystis salina]|uniref:Glutathione S-transferase family protein n=1 Tax=Synechocystis salina LEGE 00031 TaxID=1828736 RepID=A0ABR9VS01_9SYNC|nr:glutathione S-transferase family protein [Synechocystis salina]MBE9241687.1 glutathione S-transferase family protein [Synechocystis salina LEGE 00041]MBE9254119.1 glutathione S-transferase family protein [Synechocystis salina LEGE 00031]
MYTVFGDMLSGNCYKIKLLMEFLGIDHEWVHVDILASETHTEEFRKMNPNARIPVIDLGDGRYLWESNAILNYLAENTEFLPQDRYEKAKVLQWQFFEQYSHEPYIATARYINKYLGLPKEREAEYHAKQIGGHKALSVMEKHLVENKFFLGANATIADISLYAYTHVADEGGFDLSKYLNIQRWFKDFENIPGYIKMTRNNA